jgi:hypothetical protein
MKDQGSLTEPGNPQSFVGCSAEVRCRLALDGAVAEATAMERMEWPDPDVYPRDLEVE